MRRFALFYLVAAIPYAAACGMFTGVDSTGLVASDDDGGSDSQDGGRRDSGSRDGGSSHFDGGSGGEDGGGGDSDSGTSGLDSGVGGFDAGFGFFASLEACSLTISDFNCLVTEKAGDESQCATLYVQYVTAGLCSQ